MRLALQKIMRHLHQPVGSSLFRSSSTQRELCWRSEMENSHYRWVIVAAGGLLSCVAIGSMFSLPVFLLPISRDTGWSVAGVSSAMTVAFMAMAFGSMAWGTVADRIGTRPVVLIGAVLLAASVGLASRATSLI